MVGEGEGGGCGQVKCNTTSHKEDNADIVTSVAADRTTKEAFSQEWLHG